MTVLKDIQAIVTWYGEGGYKKSSLPELQDAKSKLLTLLVTFADDVADAKKESLISTVFRKVDHHEMKSQLIESGLSAAASESKTIAELREQYRVEAEREALSYYYAQVLKSGYMIADDITQRLSVLKIELAKL